MENILTGNPALPGKPSGPCGTHTASKKDHHVFVENDTLSKQIKSQWMWLN